MIKIYLSAPHIGTKEMAAVEAAMRSNWIAPLGPEVDKFELELAETCDARFAAVVSSGTAAIHLALQLVGVQPGDRVVVQSFTFVASANPILYLGAEPVFVDSEPLTWNISPDHLQAALERCVQDGKPAKAVIAVDLYGVPACYRELEAICAKFNVPLIEDAAEALGSSYQGRPAGSFGALGVLSFNGNKIITTSGGGALLSNTESYITKARFLATQARDPAPHYQHSQVGYNYRMSNLLAALGRAQLSNLAEKIKVRRAHFASYKEALGPRKVIFPAEIEGVCPNRWLTTAIFPKEHFPANTTDGIREALLQVGIESRPLWKPLHMQPLFKGALYCGGTCAEDLFSQGICFPSGSGLSSGDIDTTIAHVERFLDGL